MILHNLLVRMKQKCAFSDEAAGTDIVMEFYEQEGLTNMQHRTKLDKDFAQLEDEMCEDVEQEAGRIMVSQMEFTEQAEIFSLQTELIRLVQSSNVDQ